MAPKTVVISNKLSLYISVAGIRVLGINRTHPKPPTRPRIRRCRSTGIMRFPSLVSGIPRRVLHRAIDIMPGQWIRRRSDLHISSRFVLHVVFSVAPRFDIPLFYYSLSKRPGDCGSLQTAKKDMRMSVRRVPTSRY